MRIADRSRPSIPPRSAFAGFRFPPDVIVVAVRWYLRFGLSYRDVEELLTERGVEVDHVTVYRWVLRFTRAAGRRRQAVPPCCRRPLASRRDVCEGRWPVALHLPSDRPIRTGHRRVRLRPPGREGCPSVLGAGHRRDQDHACRGYHRSGAGVSDRAGGTPAGGVASNRTVRQQPGRGGSRPPQGEAATNAWPKAGPQRQGRSSPGTPSSRTFGADTTSWPLRSRQSATGDRVRRTGLGDLIRVGRGASACPGRAQRNIAGGQYPSGMQPAAHRPYRN